MTRFRRETRVPVAPDEVFAWHTRPGAFERLTPPWEKVRVIERDEKLEPGSKVVLSVRMGPIRRRWVAEHTEVEEGRLFADRQVEGPFARWEHTHLFEPANESATDVIDDVDYELPLGWLGRTFGGRTVERTLERMFHYRHARLASDLRHHGAAAATAPLTVAIAGASGTIGSALSAFLTTGGHVVRPLVRGRAAGPGEVWWDPAAGQIEAAALEGVDVVVNLTGRRIDTRWTSSARSEIWSSRVDATRLLAQAIAGLDHPPRVFVSGSAVGFYGSRGDELLDETAATGDGYLAELCQAWEQATVPAEASGIRVVQLRTGVVLSLAGPPLPRLARVYGLGLGGPIGSPDGYLSWVAPDDVVGGILHVIREESIAGPVNLVAPNPASQRELASTLGGVLRRPSFMRVPGAALRVAYGQMATETVLASQRCHPGVLESTGYRFTYPSLEEALRAELGRPAKRAGASGSS